MRVKISNDFDFAKVEEAYKIIISSLPLTTESVSQTSNRATKALAELTKGYSETVEEVIGQGIFPHRGNTVIQVNGIKICSLCEHHLLPFIGTLSVSYIPNGSILGLSKMKRIADVFSRRLQVQERLTEQIADAVENAVKAKGVLVVLRSVHLCMVMRGVNESNSETCTEVARGEFANNEALKSQYLKSSETRPKI